MRWREVSGEYGRFWLWEDKFLTWPHGNDTAITCDLLPFCLTTTVGDYLVVWPPLVVVLRKIVEIQNHTLFLRNLHVFHSQNFDSYDLNVQKSWLIFYHFLKNASNISKCTFFCRITSTHIFYLKTWKHILNVTKYFRRSLILVVRSIICI